MWGFSLIAALFFSKILFEREQRRIKIWMIIYLVSLCLGDFAVYSQSIFLFIVLHLSLP